ncbi:MAG TPA: hypothetical protein ENK14_01660 [Caldithrix sp.]|nr:hypothetical protein [Caldithrix sp.]
MSKRAKRFQRISRKLTTHQLRRLQETEVALSYEELFGSGRDNSASPFFLGYYSVGGINYALEKYGVFDLFRKKGFENLKLTINTDDPYKQRIAVYFDRKSCDHLLAELVLKRKNITVYPPFPARIHGRNFEVIAVEWLCMQNPNASFSPERPRLPGQKYPGLGMGDIVMELLLIMCGRLRTAGLLNVPEHFHNAQMYTPQFRYINPEFSGKLRAIARDLLSKYSLSTASWAIDLDCVLENGHPFQWFIGEQVIPLDRDLKDYFNSKDYLKMSNKTAEEYSYSLNEEKWNRLKNKIDNEQSC